MATTGGWATFEQMLKSYGLGDLSAWAKDQFVAGKTLDEINLSLEDQPAFRQQFSAIFDRRAKGLPPVSASDIVAYRQEALYLEHQYDLPAGMISDMAHVNAAVGSDVSFPELKQRVTLGANEALNQPPEVRDWLKQTYGIGDGGLIAFFTDPNHAMPYLERAAASSMLAGAGIRQGFGTLSQAEAERLNAAGVSPDQANAQFGRLAQSKELLNPLAGTGESAIGRDQQLGIVEGEAGPLAALQRQAAGRKAVFNEGGGYGGKGLVSGTAGGG